MPKVGAQLHKNLAIKAPGLLLFHSFLWQFPLVVTPAPHSEHLTTHNGLFQLLLALLLPFVALSYGLPPSATSFEAGRSYTYSYDSQTATGMILQPDAHHSFGLSNPSNSSSQRSLLRIKAVVNLQFKSSDKHQAILQLSGVRIGAARREVDSPASRLQPWSSFEPKDNHADQEKRDQLQLPVGFRYEKGLVSTIVFDGRDMPWSKNFKKAILTLLQINLEKEHDEDEDIKQGKYASDRQHQSTFTLPETTVEGKCPVTYSIDHTHGGMNVSKHVHLRHCSLTSDISFGFDSIKDDVLQRSTTIRYKLAGQDPTQYGIQRVKAYSHYLFTSPEWSYSSTEQPKDAIQPLLQTNVVSELHFRGSQPSSTNFNQPPGGEEESETLLLNTAESIKEKRLFMYGDADQQLGKRGRQWRGGNTNEMPHYAHPAFFKEKERVDQARIVINKILSQSAFEQTKGISTQAVVYIGQLVELLRKCSVKEIEAIYVKYSGDETTAESLTNTPAYGRQNEKARQIVDDCLAAAGTRNALFVLSQRIQNQDISIVRAAFVLKAVMGSIHSSPSDDQAKIMVELCQSSVVNGDSIAKQSCWLTTGALIEEVCRPRPEAMRKQLGNGNDKMCSSAKKEFYVQTLVQNYKSATTTSDKIVALKVIGNAGLDMIPEIDQILQSVPDQDKQLATILQVHALDALRRLRKHMPKKVARFVLPIVLDKKEKSSVRISAFWQLMGCQPVEKSTIDQLIYMLKEEDHSAQLYSFIYTTFETMAASREFSQMHIAKYLTKVMQELPPMYERSRILSMRLNSKQNPMGNPLAINFANIGSHTSLLPLFTSIGLGSPAQSPPEDFAPHGHSVPDSIQLSHFQKGMEQWYEDMIKQIQPSNFSRSAPKQWHEHSFKELDQLKAKLRINKRSAQPGSGPLSIYSIRMDDIDQFSLVADETYLAKLLKQMPENDGLQTSKNIKCNLVLSVGEKWAQIPTSSGLVLKFGHSLPAMASVNGRVQVKSASAASLRLKFQVQPTVRVAHIHTMEVVSPIVAAGVENMQSVETNYPIDLEVESVALTEENESGLRFTFNTPQASTKKITLFSMHTLPTIHTREFSAKSQRLGEAQIQSIVHPCLQPLQHQVNQSFGANPKFSFKGQLHWPKPSRSMAPFEQFQIQEVLRLLSTSENHVKVEMEGSGEGPVSLSQSLQLTFSGKMFQKKSVSDLDNSLTKFQDFYANWNQFQHDQVSNGRDLQAQLNGQIKMIKERNSVYQHSQNLRIRFRNVVPGIKDYVGVRASLKTDCEDTMRYCDIDCQFRMGEEVEVEKTLPLTLLRVKQKASVSFILPETSASVEEFQKARESTDKFVSMVMRVDAEYEAEAQTELGRGRKLEQGGRQNISMRVHGDTAWTPEETEMLPKINKFYAKTKLEGEQLTGPHTPEYISRWNNMESVAYVDPHTQKSIDVFSTPPDGKIIAIAHIEFYDPLRLPSLIRPLGSEPADSKGPSSVQELLAAASLTTRARCWANGRTLSTFQQISYEAPLSQCYSVLAKDCDSSEEKPRFIVLMKKIGGRAKDGYKLKVITAQETVEAMPSPERDDSYEQEMSQLEVKVNGETYRKSSSSTVRFLNEKKTEIGVDVEGLHIRFNGQEVWLKVSKGQQPDVCGVCEGIEGEDVEQEQNQEKDQQISQLHRKFSVAQPDDQGTCSQSLLDDFYAQTKMGRKPSGKANQQRDEQEQFGSAEEEDNKEKKMIEPVAFIQMQEYKHKVCFSTSPISACPKGSSPATSSSDEEEETAKVVSATFACLERADVQTRQMIRVARRAGVVFKNSKAREQQEWLEGIVSGLAQSYAEDVKIPKSCMLD